jgi:hypothetical protein
MVVRTRPKPSGYVLGPFLSGILVEMQCYTDCPEDKERYYRQEFGGWVRADHAWKVSHETHWSFQECISQQVQHDRRGEAPWLTSELLGDAISTCHRAIQEPESPSYPYGLAMAPYVMLSVQLSISGDNFAPELLYSAQHFCLDVLRAGRSGLEAIRRDGGAFTATYLLLPKLIGRAAAVLWWAEDFRLKRLDDVATGRSTDNGEQAVPFTLDSMDSELTETFTLLLSVLNDSSVDAKNINPLEVGAEMQVLWTSLATENITADGLAQKFASAVLAASFSVVNTCARLSTFPVSVIPVLARTSLKSAVIPQVIAPPLLERINHLITYAPSPEVRSRLQQDLISMDILEVCIRLLRGGKTDTPLIAACETISALVLDSERNAQMLRTITGTALISLVQQPRSTAVANAALDALASHTAVVPNSATTQGCVAVQGVATANRISIVTFAEEGPIPFCENCSNCRWNRSVYPEEPISVGRASSSYLGCGCRSCAASQPQPRGVSVYPPHIRDFRSRLPNVLLGKLRIHLGAIANSVAKLASRLDLFSHSDLAAELFWAIAYTGESRTEVFSKYPDVLSFLRQSLCSPSSPSYESESPSQSTEELGSDESPARVQVPAAERLKECMEKANDCPLKQYLCASQTRLDPSSLERSSGTLHEEDAAPFQYANATPAGVGISPSQTIGSGTRSLDSFDHSQRYALGSGLVHQPFSSQLGTSLEGGSDGRGFVAAQLFPPIGQAEGALVKESPTKQGRSRRARKQ